MNGWIKKRRIKLTELSLSPRPSPLGSDDLLLAMGVLLGVDDPPGLFLTKMTSQQAWSSFRALFPAFITLKTQHAHTKMVKMQTGLEHSEA